MIAKVKKQSLALAIVVMIAEQQRMISSIYDQQYRYRVQRNTTEQDAEKVR